MSDDFEPKKKKKKKRPAEPKAPVEPNPEYMDLDSFNDDYVPESFKDIRYFDDLEEGSYTFGIIKCSLEDINNVRVVKFLLAVKEKEAAYSYTQWLNDSRGVNVLGGNFELLGIDTSDWGPGGTPLSVAIPKACKKAQSEHITFLGSKRITLGSRPDKDGNPKYFHNLYISGPSKWKMTPEEIKMYGSGTDKKDSGPSGDNPF